MTQMRGTSGIKLRVSADHYQGDPQLQVFLDGQQIGQSVTIEAKHNQNQWQEITIPGDFDVASTDKIELRFINDLYSGAGVGEGHDRNVFVDWVEVGGRRFEAEQANNTASLGYDFDKSAAEMLTNGSLTVDLPGSPHVPDAPPIANNPGGGQGNGSGNGNGNGNANAGGGNGSGTPQTPPAQQPGPNTPSPDTASPEPSQPQQPVAEGLKLRVSGDHNHGSPQFQVFIDGEQVGDTFTVQAKYSLGQWQEITIPGEFDFAQADSLEIRFINDLYSGKGVGEGHDRNLFVDWVEVDGHRLQGEAAHNGVSLGFDSLDASSAEMLTNGALTFDLSALGGTPGAPTPPATGGSPTEPANPTTPPATDTGGNEPTVPPVVANPGDGGSGTTPPPSNPGSGEPPPDTGASPGDPVEPPGAGQPSAGIRQYFAPDSLWNTPIGDKPLAENSDHIAGLLDNSPFGVQLNQSEWTVNVAYADADTPRYTITGRDQLANWKMDNVPLPEEAYGTADDDSILIVVDEEMGKVWNMFQAGNIQETHQASSFGVFDLDGSGWWDQDAHGDPWIWTGRSSNASYLGGLIMPEELEAGKINHALAVAVDSSLLSDPVLPAQMTDGFVPNGVPNGTRLQLDPNLDLDTLDLGPEARVIAEALQTYGAFVVDKTTGFAMYFRSDQNMGYDPYAGMDFSGLDESIHDHWRVIAPEAPAEYESVFTQGQYVHQ